MPHELNCPVQERDIIQEKPFSPSDDCLSELSTFNGGYFEDRHGLNDSISFF
jgi:hypothetical protein